MKRKAIIIPANPLLPYKYGPSIGSILDHISHLEKNGKVIWDLIPPGNNNSEFRHYIKTGYFYNTTEKYVTHSFDVEKVIKINHISRKFSKFLLDARKKYYKKGNNYFSVLITGIYTLKRKHKLSDFRKYKDGKRVRRVQNYCIVNDPKFSHYNKKNTRQEIMSNYIVDLLIRGTVTENDIEELFYYYLMEKQKIIDRQGSFKGGRLDLLCNHGNRYIVYELKKGVAPLRTLQQIKGYMKSVRKKYKLKKEKIEGIILCKDADPYLWEKIKSEKNIKIKKYFFSINYK